MDAFNSITPNLDGETAGKPYTWKPTVPSDITLEPLADDARPEMQQVAHYAMLCVAMQATLLETDDIIRALQQCERIHGFNRIGPVFATMTAAIENAVALIPMPITMLGIRRQLSNPGLFVGSLVEELARVPGNTRKFPMSQYRERLHSPYVEFEDCLLGAGIAKKLQVLSENNPQASRPYSRLITEFRRKHGQDGILVVDETAREIRDQYAQSIQVESVSSTTLVKAFIAVIKRKAHEKSVTLPALWRLYVTDMPA